MATSKLNLIAESWLTVAELTLVRGLDVALRIFITTCIALL